MGSCAAPSAKGDDKFITIDYLQQCHKKIRTLLVQCARVFIQKLEHQSGKLADWVRDLLCRKSNFVVTCALANKLARIAWALTARQQTYVA
ncbi:hypothetical protein HL546_00030 [Escherichia coli]|nr:hypothetical protein [Escherichia coli]MBW9517781.1 hypothetical protein [Escherichia coli]MBW9523110.1 hypothetical protein [Escherichia coli]MBW9580398.1 hypothetical protein [Escherichia coli]MBW9614656.1 hypothetical protein [Escherichia coli]